MAHDDDREKWLLSLTFGTSVALHQPDGEWRTRVIDSVTMAIDRPECKIVIGGNEFRIYGNERGHNKDIGTIYPIDDKTKDDIEQSELRSYVGRINIKGLTLKGLREVKAAVERDFNEQREAERANR